MNTIALPHVAVPRLKQRASGGAARVRVLRSTLLIACAVALALAWAMAAPASSPPADPALAMLFRVMAAIKALLAVMATALVYWRFALPISSRAAAAYIMCTALLFVACALLWQCTFIALGALLFHGSGLSALVIAWREGDAVPRLARGRGRSFSAL